MELLKHGATQFTNSSPDESGPDGNPGPATVAEYLSAVRATTESDRAYATEMSNTMIELVKAIHLSKTRAAAHGDIEHSDFVLLIKLVKEGPRRASDLADQMCFDPSTVSRQVAVMVKAGLIERRADPDDGRASILHPTDAGRARIAEHTRVRGMVMAPLVTGWSEAEREIFLRLLGDVSRGITNNLEIVQETVGRLTGRIGDPPSAAHSHRVHSPTNDSNNSPAQLHYPRSNS